MPTIHPNWITDRLPTATDADDRGTVYIPTNSTRLRNDPITAASWACADYETIIVVGQPWWSPNAVANAQTKPAITYDDICSALHKLPFHQLASVLHKGAHLLDKAAEGNRA
jgi:hypothetical protein